MIINKIKKVSGVSMRFHDALSVIFGEESLPYLDTYLETLNVQISHKEDWAIFEYGKGVLELLDFSHKSPAWQSWVYNPALTQWFHAKAENPSPSVSEDPMYRAFLKKARNIARVRDYVGTHLGYIRYSKKAGEVIISR